MSTVLFHIDHMNDSATYIQKLQTWSEELKLGAVLLYRMRTKAVNASSGGKSVTPKGRAEQIWVLLGECFCTHHKAIGLSVVFLAAARARW